MFATINSLLTSKQMCNLIWSEFFSGIIYNKHKKWGELHKIFLLPSYGVPHGSHCGHLDDNVSEASNLLRQQHF